MIQNINKRLFLFLLFILIGSTAFGQTTIGKLVEEGPDVILDFKLNDNRGIILPWVKSQAIMTDVVGGTFIFDSNDKKIKYYKAGASPRWEDLSVNTGIVDVSIQADLTENNNKTIIGDQSSLVPGLLVLEADDKAMVLPKVVSPHLNMKSPKPGTIVYDTVSKMICLFNGVEWSFWKAGQ